MNSFIDSICSMIGLDFDLLFGAFKVINFSNKAIYVEGPFSLMSVKEDEIKLKLKKGVLEIAGKNLSIKDMQKNALAIIGNITHFEIN